MDGKNIYKDRNIALIRGRNQTYDRIRLFERERKVTSSEDNRWIRIMLTHPVM